MYKIIPHKKVSKFINSRNIKDKQRIKEKFELLQENPYPTNDKIDTKRMTNQNIYRLRVGNFRFLYKVVENELVIYMNDGNNRGDIY